MYLAKKDKFNDLDMLKKDIAEEVGITIFTLSRIINRVCTTSKTTAYCIVKTINENAEIEDFFEKNN